MGGVCSSGTSSILDAEGADTEVSGSSGKQKQKAISSLFSSKGVTRKACGKSDGGSMIVPSRAKSSPSTVIVKGSTKGAFSEKTRTLSLKKAVKVLDTLGKSIPGLSKDFVSGLVSRGNKVSILAFEVANTVVKGVNLVESLSENSIRALKDTLQSEGVQRLVSRDINELLMIASSDKREEFDVFLREVIRFGDLCKDPHWHNLGRYFSRLCSAGPNIEPMTEKAETVELSLLARNSSELYHEMNVLDRFEQDYKQKLDEAKYLDSYQRGGELTVLHDELKHQRKLVRSLKTKSLWSRNMEEIIGKLVDMATYIYQKLVGAFGNNGTNSEDGKFNNSRRLGPAGLALHYANIIVQIDTIASRPGCLPHNVRDSLYHALPSSVKIALQSRLKETSLNEMLPISRVKADMDKTLRWLFPFATNTIKAHQKFGWIGDWANAGKNAAKSSSTGIESLRILTLYHGDKEKMDLYIIELVVRLHHLISLVKQRVCSRIRPLRTTSSSHQKGSNLNSYPEVQKFPPMNYTIPKQEPPKSPRLELSQEDKNLLEGMYKRRTVPGISKSRSMTVSRKRKMGKICPTSRSMGSSPSRETRERTVPDHHGNGASDLTNGLDESES